MSTKKRELIKIEVQPRKVMLELNSNPTEAELQKSCEFSTVTIYQAVDKGLHQLTDKERGVTKKVRCPETRDSGLQ